MTTTHRLAERIEVIRKDRNVDVAALARDTGIADKTLRRRRSHPGQYTLAELAAICERLDVPVEDILNLDLPVEALLRRVAA